MTTLRIQNTVRDYDSWKVAFDKYERTRADRGVRSYRVSREAADPRRVCIDLEFDDHPAAEAFCLVLQKVWSSPKSQAELLEHGVPVLLDVADERVLRQPTPA